jgi:hypothetical protein
LNDPSFNLPQDPMCWRATCHHNENLLEVAARFKSGVWSGLRLLYVWGHSYEFDRQNNWSLIEEFAKNISGNENIWYATNIEIIDYLDAAKRLTGTLDGKRMYNPSALSVWVKINGKPVEIPAGKLTVLPEK